MVQSIIACWIIFGVLGFHTFWVDFICPFWNMRLLHRKCCWKSSTKYKMAKLVLCKTKGMNVLCLCKTKGMKRETRRKLSSYAQLFQSINPSSFFARKKKLMENMVLTGKCKWQWITGCFHEEKYLGFMKSGNVIFRMNANWQKKEMFRISEHAKEWKFQ